MSKCRTRSRWFSSFVLWSALSTLLPATAPVWAGEDLTSVPRRILVRLPQEMSPRSTLSYSQLRRLEHDGTARRERVEIAGSARLTALLEQWGASGLARLDEGLRAAPPAWTDWYVASFTPPLSREEAAQLVTELQRVEPRLQARVDAVYELLEVPGSRRAVASTPADLGRPPRRRFESGGANLRSGFLPDDPYFADGTQWGLFNEGVGPVSSLQDLDVRAPEAWAQSTGSTALVVGILDTGVDSSHPDLFRPLADGSPRLLHLSAASGDGSGGADSHGHGTNVLGVLAALTNNGATIGGQGVAGMLGGAGGDSLGARIVVIKITSGSGSTAAATDMARAILDAHLWGARVINLSFAGTEPSDMVREALAFVADRGTIVVCGAGNWPNSILQFPGSYSRFGLTLSVGAMAPDGTLAVFSTRGDQLDVVAPGQEIMSTWLTYANAQGSSLRNYALNSGTSFAAPFVAGALGLAAARGVDLRANDYQEVVRRTARDWGATGRDTLFGSGLLDVDSLLRGLEPPHGLRRGTEAAGSWTRVARESLRVLDSGIRQDTVPIDGAYEAEVWEVTARVTGLTDLLGSPQVWARYTGGGWSRGPRHEYDYAWGELVPGSERPDGFDLRTYAYFIDQPPNDCPACTPVGWVPRPPAEVSVDWTAWARWDAPPDLVVHEPAARAEWVSGETRTVRWTASDPDAVSRVIVSWFDGVTEKRLGTSFDAAGEMEVEVPCRSTGSPFLRVTARDEEGLTADETTVEVALFESGAPCSGGAFYLAQPRPNPARGVIRFTFGTAAGTAAHLRILDLKGREVARLPVVTDGQPAEVLWRGLDRNGGGVPSGVYHAVLDVGGERRIQRFVWLR